MTAHFDDTTRLIYFEAKEKQNQTNKEFILAYDEKSEHFSIDLVPKIIHKINESLHIESQIKK